MLTSSTIDKKLENFEFIFEFKIAIKFEFNFEIFCKFRVYFRDFCQFRVFCQWQMKSLFSKSKTLKSKTLTFKFGGLGAEIFVRNHKSIPIYI